MKKQFPNNTLYFLTCFTALLLIAATGFLPGILATDISTTPGKALAFWPLDDGRGQHIRNQLSDDFHGAVEGEGFIWEDGVATFPGRKIGGHIKIADGGKLLAGPAFEISLEVRLASANATGPLLCTKSASETKGGFYLHYWRNGKRLSFNFSDGTKVHQFRFTFRLPLDQWSMITLRYDGTNVIALVDQKEIGRHSSPGLVLRANPGAALRIGGYPSNTDCWDGQLRNVRLKRLESSASVPVARASSPPAIDGKLDEPVWKDAVFHPSSCGPPTRYALIADDTHLYVAARCAVGGDQTGKSSPLRILIDPQATGHRYFQITLDTDNEHGTALVSYYGRLVQERFAIAKLMTATRQTATEWTAEIAIPFASLAVPEDNPDYWQFHLSRLDSNKPAPPGSGDQAELKPITGVPAPRYTAKEKRAVGSLIYQWKFNDPAPLDVDLRFRPSHDTWFVANNMVVPNWFNTDLPAKAIGDFDAHLLLDIPEGIELLHVGTFKADDPVKTKLRHSRFTWHKEDTGGPVLHEGKPHTRYRVEVTEIHQKLNTIGPFYLRSSSPDDTAQTLYFQTVYPHSDRPLEKLQVLTKKFPTPGPPKKLLASLTWISPADYMTWPGMLNHYSRLGFNALPIHRRHNYLLDSGARSFLDSARKQNLYMVAVDSPFHGLSHKPGAQSVLASGRTVHDVCPAYRGSHYQDELETIASWSTEIQADYLILDVECFQKGADYGISRSCARCVDYITKTQLPPRDAMISLGTQIQRDVHQTVGKAHHQLGITPPNIGFYHSKPGGFVYQGTLKFDAAYPDAVDHAQPVFYNGRKDSTGPEVRRLRKLMEKGDLMPWFTSGFFVPGSRPIEYPSAWVYDRVLEGYGNGIRGINWFTFANFEAADFYYHAKAMESVNQVDALIYDSQPLEGIEVSEPYQATAITHPETREILLLVSDYSQAAGGQLTVTFPDPLPDGFHLYDLALRKKLKVVSGKVITFHFKPGAEGAHTALFVIAR